MPEAHHFEGTATKPAPCGAEYSSSYWFFTDGAASESLSMKLLVGCKRRQKPRSAQSCLAVAWLRPHQGASTAAFSLVFACITPS